MKELFHHFSHEHPLIDIFEDEAVDQLAYFEDEKGDLCSICGLPILSTPSYTCANNANCNFFLHKPCAKLQPSFRSHPSHDPTDTFMFLHSLKLEKKSPQHQNFSYKCSFCKFAIHPLVAEPVEIKIRHKSHPQHPLVAICKEITAFCDACGEKQTGFFFSCRECNYNFSIHQDCTLLPSVVKLHSHQHLFFLTYSLPRYMLDARTCVICKRSWLRRHNGVYFCGECRSFAHLSCGNSNKESLGSGTRVKLIQLPDDEGDTFPSLVIRRYAENNSIRDEDINDDKIKLTIEKHLNHRNLKSCDDGIGSGTTSLVCDVCIQPINISSPFYSQCNFLAHNICANLLSRPVDFCFSIWDLAAKPSLCQDLNECFFNSVFICFVCRRPSNGACYSFYEVTLRIFIDLECMAAPNTIKHASHGQHVLFQTSGREDFIFSCCPDESLYHDVYRCLVCCDFCIHVRCALLPKRTWHKFDEHPLELITSTERKHWFCEVCEKGIAPQYWFYRCGECDQSFHINCIPSCGHLSKVKFGTTHSVSSHIHIHPLVLTRLLTVPRNERCGHCAKIIKGFVDEMAFCCFECDFWMHFSCARDCSAAEKSTALRVYWETWKEYEDIFRQIRKIRKYI